MAYFRYWFCQPTETYNSLCAVPVFEDAVDETQWCIDNHDATNCTAIRDSAQERAARSILWFYTGNAIWTLLLVFIGFLVVDTLQNIISRPLVQKSRENNLPMWLSLPIVGSGLVGVVLTFSSDSVLNIDSEAEGRWIGPMYIASGALFSLASFFSWVVGRISIFSTRQKWWKQAVVMCFLIVSILLVAVLVTLFIGSIVYSSSLISSPLSDSARGNFACAVDQAGSCTQCDSTTEQRCPEWTTEDVTRVVQSQAKASASLAGIFLLYTSGMIQFGRHLWKITQSYQIDYV